MGRWTAPFSFNPSGVLMGKRRRRRRWGGLRPITSFEEEARVLLSGGGDICSFFIFLRGGDVASFLIFSEEGGAARFLGFFEGGGGEGAGDTASSLIRAFFYAT